MRFERIGTTLMVAAIGVLAGAPARAADIDIAQNPLFLLAPVKPAMVMAVDDSGSMDSETVMPTNDGALWWHDDRETFTGFGTNASNTDDVWFGDERFNFNASGSNDGTWQKYTYLFPNGGLRRLNTNSHHAVPPIPAFAYARSHVYNPIYFDPTQTYEPLPSAGTATFSDATPTAAKWDAVTSSQTVDLTQNIQRDENDWVFRVEAGMTIPKGTIVDDPDQGDFCVSEDLDWEPLSEDFLATEDDCRLAIEYFPATFWLPASDGPPTGFVGTAIPGGEAPDGSEMLGYEIKPNNFSNYDEMIQNFANWFQYYRKRSHLTRAAIGQSFEGNEFLRVGAFEINNRNDVTMLDLSNTTQRQSFFDQQYTLTADGGTPNKQAVFHMGEQFERTGDNAPIVEACQKNFGVLFTDGFSNSWDNAGVGNTDGAADSDLAGTFLADSESNTMADIAYHFYSRNLRGDLAPDLVPVPTACTQPNPSLDLDCNDDPHMNFFAVLLGGVGLEFRVDEAATENPYENNPDWPTNFPQRNPAAIDDIWHGTLNARGRTFSADRPQDLIEAFSQLLADVASAIQPVGVSATSTRLDQDSLFYEAELDSTAWSGDLQAKRAEDGGVEWTASNAMGSPDSRKILTSNGSGAEEAFDTGLSPTTRNRIFGSTITDTSKQNAIISYLRGVRGNEQQNGGELRNRDGIIGDIANSRPRFSGPRNEGWGRLDAAYLDYIAEGGPKESRDAIVLVGANAGMLHAFNAESGAEEFAYVPAGVHEKLPALADPDYSHQFYVDGQIRIGDAKIGGWKTVAVGGLGGGGKGVFALDISNPSAPDLLWELSPDDHPELGHVFGQPVITRLGDSNNASDGWVAIFGNGYNSDSGQPHLFVVDLATGNVLQKIAVGDTDGNGLSGVAAFLDPVTRLFTRRIYAGDLAGNMWRFDFSDAGTGASEFGASTPLINADGRPIASAPSLAENPGGGLMVYFGTGKLIETTDRVGNVSDFDSFYAVRDRDSSFNNANSLDDASMSGNPRVVTGADATGDSDGWVLELGVGSASGERVLSRPEVVFGSLVFTTFEPDDDPCAAGGQRRIYILDALTGGGLLDQICPNCGVIDVGLGAPVDPAIVIRPPKTKDSPDDPPDNPFDPGGEGPGAGDVASKDGWCSELVILVPGEGFVAAGRICDGRQAWRQAR